MIKIFTFSSSDSTLKEFQNEINNYIENHNLSFGEFEVKVTQSEDDHNVNLTVVVVSKKQ